MLGAIEVMAIDAAADTTAVNLDASAVACVAERDNKDEMRCVKELRSTKSQTQSRNSTTDRGSAIGEHPSSSIRLICAYLIS